MTYSETNTKKNGRKFNLLILFILLSIVVFGVYLFTGYEKSNITQIKQDTTKKKNELDSDYIKAIVQVVDSTADYIRVSEPGALNLALDKEAGKNENRVFSGRRINIAITGVDARIGTDSRHGDANHVMSILIDSGKIEIISIPRDTEADLGYADTSGMNKLTYVRALRGRDAYLKEVARIAKLDKIHYFVEFGFSQAMGIIEFLGFKDPQKTLAVLRSRKGLGGDDYQRCYNQGQFIRQASLKQFEKLLGTMGSLFIRGGLAFVETNLTYETAKDIVDKLKAKGFPKNAGDVSMYVRPAIPIDYKVFDFSNMQTLEKLAQRIDSFNSGRFQEGIEEAQPKRDVAGILNSALDRASKDTLKNPEASIKTLYNYYLQRAWYQVLDLKVRDKIRERFAKILSSAYERNKQHKSALEVLYNLDIEKQLSGKK